MNVEKEREKGGGGREGGREGETDRQTERVYVCE